MFSKLIRVATATVFTVVQLGCGLSTGETSPDMARPAFSGKGYSCVGQIPRHLERYVWDELNDSQITEFVQCLQKAFTTFVQLTRGKDKEAYAPEEIRRFLQAYFLRERPITDELMNEFMVIKQVLVGGEVDIITRPEITELIEFLEDVRREAIRIRPYIKYLNPKLILNQDPSEIGARLQEANEILRQAIRVLTLRLQGGQKDYSFAHLATLMTEFRGFVRWDEHFKNTIPVAAWIEFFKTFKATTVNPQNVEMMRMNEWAPFLQTFVRWYLAYIQYRVGVAEQPVLRGVGLQNTLHLGHTLFDLAEEAVHRQPNKVLTIAQVNSLVASAQKLGWLPARVRAQSVEKFTRALIDRVFADEKAVAGRNQGEGVSLQTLTLARYEFYRWAYIQMQLDQRYNPERNANGGVPSLHSNFFIPAHVQNKLRNMRDADWEHFLKIRTLTRPLFNSNLSRATVAHPTDSQQQDPLEHGFHNLSVMNLLRSSVGLLFRGYGEMPGRRWDWNSTLKSESLQAFYEDIRDLAVDLTLADPRVENTGARAFIEGNLFTFSGDGVAFDVNRSRLTFVEAMELLALLYSGGQMSTDAYKALKDKCKNGPADGNGDAMIERACVLERVPEMIELYGANLPGMHQYVRTAPVEERFTLAKNILDSAFSPKSRVEGVPPESRIEWVERSELAIVAVVLHYLEAVTIRFDANRDGVLTSDELRKAVPVFSGFIQRYAKDKLQKDLSVRDAEGVFLYILAYKSFPTSWNTLRVWWLSYDLQWEFDFGWGWKLPVNINQNIKLTRAELSSVFRVIVAKLFDTVPVAEQIRILNRQPDPAPCQTLEQFKEGECTIPGVQK